MLAADGKHEFEGEVLATTAKAILFRGDYWDKPEHAEGVWLARSKVEIEFDTSDTSDIRATVLIPQWMARNDKLEDYE